VNLKNIFLFDSYINQIYEADHSDHSKKRTSLDDKISRIVPFSLDNSSGFILEGIIDSNESRFDPDEVEEILGLDSDIVNEYISRTLYLITNSKKIEDLKSSEKKPFQLVDLGRICFKRDDEKYYPLIAGGRGEGQNGFYDGGDNIWLFVKPTDTITTIKYYEKSDFARRMMFDASAEDSGMTYNDFREVSEYVYPYGRSFEAIIDVTYDDSIDEVMERVKRQIERGRTRSF
jgi:hypothetical protein